MLNLAVDTAGNGAGLGIGGVMVLLAVLFLIDSGRK